MHVLLESGKRELVLEEPPLARGGEAAIYGVAGEPNLAAKIYYRPVPEQADKLAFMIATGPPFTPTAGPPCVAWPTDRLLDDTAEANVIGFLMPRLSQARRLCELANPRARGQLCPLFHYGYLLRTARNLVAAVQMLHKRGYVLGDLNESNVLVTTQALVTLVDADSFQVTAPGRLFRCRVGREEYLPPELQQICLADSERTAAHDAFALAVLIFQLLMQGSHPFAGMFTGTGEPPSLPERIRAGYWPHAWARESPFQPIPHAPPWTVLPPPVQDLFFRCFEDGHANPAQRPTAAAWQEALTEAESQLTACSANAQHRYPRGLDACPWCILARQHDHDPFPSADQLAARRATTLAVSRESSSTDGDFGSPMPAVKSAPAVAVPAVLDPDDPLPPRSQELEQAPAADSRASAGRSAAAANRNGIWVALLAAGAAGAVLGMSLQLWRYCAAVPERTSRAHTDLLAAPHRSAPTALPAVRGAAPVHAEGQSAPVSAQPPRAAAHQAVSAAERAWQKAVLAYQQAQLRCLQAQLEYTRQRKEFVHKHGTSRGFPRSEEWLRVFQHMVLEKGRELAHQAQVLEQARQGLLAK